MARFAAMGPCLGSQASSMTTPSSCWPLTPPAALICSMAVKAPSRTMLPYWATGPVVGPGSAMRRVSAAWAAVAIRPERARAARRAEGRKFFMGEMVVWLRVVKDISSGGRGITLKGAPCLRVGVFYWGASGAPRLRWGLGLQLRWGRPPHGYPLWLYGRWGDIVPCRVGCWRPKAPQGVPARRPFVEGGRPWMRGIDCAHGDFRGSTSLGVAVARVPPVALRALG